MADSAAPASPDERDIRSTSPRGASIGAFLRDEPRAVAIVAAFLANLLLNGVNVVPFIGPVVELLGDAGVETIALVLAGSLLRRDGRPLKGLLVLGGLGLLKTALNGLNLLPEIGSLMELATELGLDLTQVWFLKELLTRRSPPTSTTPKTGPRTLDSGP